MAKQRSPRWPSPGEDLRLTKDVVYGVKHDAFEDDLGRSLIRAWSAGAQDEVITSFIRERVHKLQRREAFGQLSPFRIPRLNDGEIQLGAAMDGAPVRYPLQGFNAGFGFWGNTGSGKSNTISLVLPQIAANGVNIWVSEMYKQQMRGLRPLLQQAGKDLIVLRPHDWRFNLLQAGHGNARAHLSLTTDLLVRVLGLPSRARAILSQAGYDLYRRFSIWDGQTAEWPCLFDLYEWIRSVPGLNAASRDAILDRLGSLLCSLTPACAAYRSAWMPSDLARFSIDFEMRGAPETVKQLVLTSTLASLLQAEVDRGVVNDRLRLFVVFEDGQRFFDLSQQIGGGEISPMDELAGVIRGCAIGLGVTSQTAQGFSNKLRPNLTTKIFGRLGCNEDYLTLGADLGLNRAQIDWARRHLKPGLFIAQAGDGDWREPFIMRVPLIPDLPQVSDEEAAESVRVLDAISVRPAPEYARWEPAHIAKFGAPGNQKASLSETEFRFLKAVVENPGQKSSDYARLARMSGQRATQIRERLVGLGFLREHSVATGQRGRNAIVLEPLEAAAAALDEHNSGE